MTALGAFLYGVVGGVIAQIMVVAAYQRVAVKDWPDFLKLRSYWVIEALLILVGGYVSKLYAGHIPGYNELLAVQVGGTAPLILEKLFLAAPKLPPTAEPDQPAP